MPVHIVNAQVSVLARRPNLFDARPFATVDGFCAQLHQGMTQILKQLVVVGRAVFVGHQRVGQI